MTGVKIMYDKIKSETHAAFLRLYPNGTLEDVTGQVIRHLAYSVDVLSIGGMSIYDALIIADEINRELGRIALEEMRRYEDG